MKYIFSDFDGTLTYHGNLTRHFFDLLDFIEEKKTKLVIVTGRSLSWGHFLLTHTNIEHVIAEGGGCYTYKDKHGHIHNEMMVTLKETQQLQNFTDRLRQIFPNIIFAKDNLGRLTDRAIEYSQMSEDDLKSIEKLISDSEIHSSRSNVHLNYWVGDISKAAAINHLTDRFFPEAEVIYFGDSTNDESVFKEFKNTIGVSNILPFLQIMSSHPRVVLSGENNREILGVLNWLKNNL